MKNGKILPSISPVDVWSPLRSVEVFTSLHSSSFFLSSPHLSLTPSLFLFLLHFKSFIQTFPTERRLQMLWFSGAHVFCVTSSLPQSSAGRQKISKHLLSWKCMLQIFDQMTRVLAKSITDPYNQPPPFAPDASP